MPIKLKIILNMISKTLTFKTEYHSCRLQSHAQFYHKRAVSANFISVGLLVASFICPWKLPGPSCHTSTMHHRVWVNTFETIF